MKKNELKTGDLIVFRDGLIRMCLNGEFVGVNGLVCSSTVDNNLKSTTMPYLDIVKVYRIYNYDIPFILANTETNSSFKGFRLVWERLEKVENPEVVKMLYSKEFLENVKQILSDLLENPKRWTEGFGICSYLQRLTEMTKDKTPKNDCYDFVNLFLKKYGYKIGNYIPESTKSFGPLRQEFARNIIKDIDAGNIPENV